MKTNDRRVWAVNPVGIKGTISKSRFGGNLKGFNKPPLDIQQFWKMDSILDLQIQVENACIAVWPFTASYTQFTA